MKKIGKIVSIYGVNGHVCIKHKIIHEKGIKIGDAFLVELWEKSYIPFFIESISSTKNEFIIKFEEIHSREEAKKLLQKNVYSIDENIEILDDNDSWLFLIGFQLKNNNTKQDIGKILNVAQLGMQVFVEIDYNHRFIHIPIHNNLIKKIDEEKKIIYLDIADGLLDIL